MSQRTLLYSTVRSMGTHIGQLPLAPLGELVGEVVQDSPSPLPGLGKVGTAAFSALLGVL